MSIIMPVHFLDGIMDVICGQLRGIGKSLQPMIIALCGVCLLRMVWIYTIFQIPQYHTLTMLYVTYPISWIVTSVVELAVYFRIIRKELPKEDMPTVEAA